MEHLPAFRSHQSRRLHSLATEVGCIPNSVLYCQVWTTCATGSEALDLDPILLRVEAQGAVSTAALRAYAANSALRGIRATGMELIGDCQHKGATRLVEDLEQADPSQHPLDKLHGPCNPACSAIFLPVFDPSDPFSRTGSGCEIKPTALLEVLVCKSVRHIYNHADLINRVCQIMDELQFAISTDATAFREWSRRVAPPALPRTPSPSAPLKPSPRSSMSRTSSMRLLSSSAGSDEAFGDVQASLDGLPRGAGGVESSWWGVGRR